MSNETDIAQLRKLLAEAEATPWNSPKWRAVETHPNNELIVAAVNALPGLLDEVERLRGSQNADLNIWRATQGRIAQLEAALREIEPAALYHPAAVSTDTLKDIIRRVKGIARDALRESRR